MSVEKVQKNILDSFVSGEKIYANKKGELKVAGKISKKIGLINKKAFGETRISFLAEKLINKAAEECNLQALVEIYRKLDKADKKSSKSSKFFKAFHKSSKSNGNRKTNTTGNKQAILDKLIELDFHNKNITISHSDGYILDSSKVFHNIKNLIDSTFNEPNNGDLKGKLDEINKTMHQDFLKQLLGEESVNLSQKMQFQNDLVKKFSDFLDQKKKKKKGDTIKKKMEQFKETASLLIKGQSVSKKKLNPEEASAEEMKADFLEAFKGLKNQITSEIDNADLGVEHEDSGLKDRLKENINQVFIDKQQELEESITNTNEKAFDKGLNDFMNAAPEVVAPWVDIKDNQSVDFNKWMILYQKIGTTIGNFNQEKKTEMQGYWEDDTSLLIDD